MDPVLPTWPIDEDVYTGFWVNRSLGKFRAATITLDQRMWNLMIAFVALFVGATARSIWKLVRFVLHHNFATSIAKDGVHHQRQAVLRNTVLATDAAIQFWEISHVWRHRGGRARALSLFAVALAVSILTTAAGFFSSELLDSSPSEVLIAGRNCGPLPFGYPPNELSWAGRVMDYNSEKAWADFLYASSCYNNKTAVDCEKFVQPSLPYTSDRNASCPFASELCKMKYGNLLLDTGDLDSVKQLGLNRGPRFTLRYRTHCAPLVTEGYRKVVPQNGTTYRNFTRYDYGMIHKPVDGPDPWIYWVEQDDKRRLKPLLPGGTYAISYMNHYWVDFIPQLTNLQAMVSLVFLDSSAVIYNYKTDDPWFSATTSVNTLKSNPSESEAEEGLYLADEPVGVLGCSTQRFVCNPDLPGSECINNYSRNKSVLAIQRAWPKPQDQQQIYPLLASNYQYGVGKGASESLYSISGAPALLARKTMTDNTQTAKLPSNQWQLEREHLFAASIAAWQSSLVAFARGSWYGHLSCNEEFICERVCHSQRVRSSSFHSFSAWMLFIILCLGILIMVVAFFLEELFELLLHRSKLGKNRRLLHAFAEWQAGSTLQLQRIAHENLGLGTWKRTDEPVPVTKMSEVLGVLDTTNTKHARLVPLKAEMNDISIDAESPATNTRGRHQYLRLPNDEHASTW